MFESEIKEKKKKSLILLDNDSANKSLYLLLSGEGKEVKAVDDYNFNLSGQYVTVFITVPKFYSLKLVQRQEHVAIALWNDTNYQFIARGIRTYDELDAENFKLEDLKDHDEYQVVYFTKKIDSKNALKMLSRMKTLQLLGEEKKIKYDKFFSNRFKDSYNCVTSVDTILWAGGESYGLASSLTTPYTYSLTFTTEWSQARVDCARIV